MPAGSEAAPGPAGPRDPGGATASLPRGDAGPPRRLSPQAARTPTAAGSGGPAAGDPAWGGDRRVGVDGTRGFGCRPAGRRPAPCDRRLGKCGPSRRGGRRLQPGPLPPSTQSLGKGAAASA